MGLVYFQKLESVMDDKFFSSELIIWSFCDIVFSVSFFICEIIFSFSSIVLL